MDMMRIYLDTCGCEEGGGTVRVSGLADGEVGIRQRSGASFYLFPQINDPQHRSTAKRITERGREEGRKCYVFRLPNMLLPHRLLLVLILTRAQLVKIVNFISLNKNLSLKREIEAEI